VEPVAFRVRLRFGHDYRVGEPSRFDKLAGRTDTGGCRMRVDATTSG
jgi:hypothetical protein